MYGLHETMIITILIAHLIQLKSFSVVDVQTRPASQPGSTTPEQYLQAIKCPTKLHGVTCVYYHIAIQIYTNVIYTTTTDF